MNNKEYIKTCKNCNKEFNARFKNTKFCSKKCRESYWYQNNKEYVKARTKQYAKENKKYIQQYKKQYYLDNKEYLNEKAHQRYMRNRNECIEKSKQWYRQNLEYKKEYDRCYYEQNIQYKKVYNSNYYLKNAEKIKTNNKMWSRNNKEKINKRSNEKYENDLQYRLAHWARTSVRRCLRSKKTQHTFDILGYTPNQLKQRLESQFKNGMTWENYGTLWHIDHKKPLKMFNFINNDGSPNYKLIQTANCLANLQPLWVKDNLIKGAKFIY